MGLSTRMREAAATVVHVNRVNPDMLTGWTSIAVTATSGQTAPDSTSTAVRLQATAGNGYYATITTTPGETITATWWAKAGGYTNAAWCAYDITHSSDIVSATAYTVTGSWAQVSKTFVVPAGCTSCRVYVQRDGTTPVDITVWGAVVW